MCRNIYSILILVFLACLIDHGFAQDAELKNNNNIELNTGEGGLLEIIVIDAITKEPIEEAQVYLASAKPSKIISLQTDKNGIAKAKLLPGEYELQFIARRPFYRIQSSIPGIKIFIENGKTQQFEFKLVPLPKIAGVVRDETGKTVSSARVNIPLLSSRPTSTDNNGRFEIYWDPERTRANISYLVAIHEERNLVAVLEIERNTKVVDITLKNGVIITGKFVDLQGNGISDIEIRPRVELSGRWLQLPRSITGFRGAKGNFEIRAVPPGQKFQMTANAEGHLDWQAVYDTSNAVDNYLKLEELTLTASGIVLDAQGRPVSNIKEFIEDIKEPTRLISGAIQASWSSDGTEIAYTRTPEPTGGIFILTLDANGKGKQITADGKDPAISPDGKWISYVREGEKGYMETVWLVSTDGKGEPKFLAEGGYPSWLPDSKAIIYHSREDMVVYQMEIAEGERQPNKLLDMPNCWYPCLSPNGKEIAYTDEAGVLIVSSLEGTGMRKRAIPSDGFLGKWSPDGKMIALGGFGSEMGLRIVDASLTNEITVLPPGDLWSRPSWSDDRRYLLYDNMRDEVWILNTENLMLPGLTKLAKSLPDFAGVAIDFSMSQAKGKPVLVCFFDMEQRPSRNYMRQLSRRAQELTAKDVVVVAIHASKVDDETLKEWAKENDISFPVGMVESDAKKTRYNWGVGSLPWLILTNHDHIVHAEGFDIDELNERITTLK